MAAPATPEASTETSEQRALFRSWSKVKTPLDMKRYNTTVTAE
jgi:hypothetical protein